MFSRARNLEAELGFGRIWVKFEGSNPTGTQKDRIAEASAVDAVEKGFTTITVATCGNFGAAVSHAAARVGLRSVIFVPTAYHTPRVVEMEAAGARVVRVPGDYEHAVEESKRAAADFGWYDSNPGGEHQWDIAQRGYGAIAREIVEQLGRVPDTVSCAVGNGTTLAGVYAGFRDILAEKRSQENVAERPNLGFGRIKEVIRERIDALPGDRARLEGAPDSEPASPTGAAGEVLVGGKLPRMIAASTPRGNPIIKSWKAGSRSCVDLKPDEIHETAVNEPLVNWHAFDGQAALDALLESNGVAAYASDAEMRRAMSLLRHKEGINVMTASTAAIVGLHKAWQQHGDALGEDHVVVLTGRTFTKSRARISATARAAAEAAPAAKYFIATPAFRSPEMVRHRS